MENDGLVGGGGKMVKYDRGGRIRGKGISAGNCENKKEQGAEDEMRDM